MGNIAYPVAGGGLGVAIPLTTEYALKGKRWGATEAEPKKGYKWSGILGIVEAVVGIGSCLLADRGSITLTEDAKAGMAAFGGAGGATGAGILILDEMRKQAKYDFKKTIDLRTPGGDRSLERTI
ncbi:unnamed protein product, partial [marine sediment metagenome]